MQAKEEELHKIREKQVQAEKQVEEIEAKYQQVTHAYTLLILCTLIY